MFLVCLLSKQGLCGSTVDGEGCSPAELSHRGPAVPPIVVSPATAVPTVALHICSRYWGLSDSYSFKALLIYLYNNSSL